jgi:hypothetical protein
MSVDASSLRKSSIGELESVFESSQHNRDFLVELHKVLETRNTKRAKELDGKVCQQLKFFDGVATGLAAVQGTKKSWYTRHGLLFSITGAIGAAIVYVLQGVFHGLGIQLWYPISRLIQNTGRSLGIL